MKRKLKWLTIVLAVSLLGFGTALLLWPRDRITPADTLRPGAEMFSSSFGVSFFLPAPTFPSEVCASGVRASPPEPTLFGRVDGQLAANSIFLT
jgi:hypothetical protein